MWILAPAVALSVIAAAVFASGHARAANTATVVIHDFKYGPPTLTVPVGTTVTWTNHDEETHTVTSATGAFSSPGLANDETFEQTFTKAGTYQYSCALHPQMRATIVVE